MANGYDMICEIFMSHKTGYSYKRRTQKRTHAPTYLSILVDIADYISSKMICKAQQRHGMKSIVMSILSITYILPEMWCSSTGRD